MSSPVRRHKLLPLLQAFHVDNISEIKDIVKHRKKDGVVLVDSFGRWGVLAVVARIWFRVPLIVRMRGDFFAESRWRYRHGNPVLGLPRFTLNVAIGALCLNFADAVIFNSVYLKGRLSNWTKGRRTAVIYNPFTMVAESAMVTTNAQKVGKRQFVLLSVTNMVLPPKVEPILDQMRKWPIEFWRQYNLRWIVCGDGLLKKYMDKVISELGLNDFVDTPGWVSNVGDYFRACDVFVHLSNMDAFPNVTLEAMSYRKPIIINTESCGTREQVFHDVNGLVVDEGATIAPALLRYIADPTVRARHGNSGYRILTEQFTVGTQKAAMTEFLMQWMES